MPYFTNRGIVPISAGVSLSALQTGCAAFYEFENTSWSDSTANGFTLTPAAAPTSVSGLVGNCASFAANSDYLRNFSDDPLLHFYATDWAISLWFNPSSTPGSAGICQFVSLGNVSTGTNLIVGYMDGPSSTFTLNINAGGVLDSVNGGAVAANTWYHVVMQYTTASKLISIKVNNGTAVTTTGTNAFADESSIRLYIGDFFVASKVDQWGFWRRLLTAGEVTNLYNFGNGLSWAAM